MCRVRPALSALGQADRSNDSARRKRSVAAIGLAVENRMTDRHTEMSGRASRMRRMTRFGVAAIATAGLVAGLGSISVMAARVHPKPKETVTAQPPGRPVIGTETQARHALIVDVATGTVLLDNLADEHLPPASMSKIMTAYVVFGMLKQGRASLQDELPVSERAWRLQGSKMFVPVGARIKIDDLLKGMIIESGNDACLVLAEGLAGSEEAFVELMNEKAKEIGLTDSHFANVSGLPDPNHWMTARDLATLSIRTMKDFPEYYHYYGQIDYEFNNIKQGNRNPLLYKGLGADGLKTGHTEEAGYSLAASVKRDGRRIVLVLAGLPTMKARAQESERLIEWAFREFNDYKLFAAGDKVEDADVWLGSEPKVPLTVGRDLVVTLPRKSRKDMKVTLEYDRPIPAPVAKGQTVGKVVVTAPDVLPAEAALVTAASVDRMDAFGRIATLAGYLVWGGRR
jgi:serine-type D-Ala-D-Ala carboxypeptidase (penicillin-binding protein 5/6)